MVTKKDKAQAADGSGSGARGIRAEVAISKVAGRKPASAEEIRAVSQEVARV